MGEDDFHQKLKLAHYLHAAFSVHSQEKSPIQYLVQSELAHHIRMTLFSLLLWKVSLTEKVTFLIKQTYVDPFSQLNKPHPTI